MPPLLAAFLLLGCAVEPPPNDDLLTLDQQLENMLVHCRNDGITDLKTLQDTLNEGGSGLSEGCIDALGKIDFEQLVALPDFQLDFDTPHPNEVINPLRQDRNWFNISSNDKKYDAHYFSSGLDTDIIGKIKLTGIAPNGDTVPLKNFILQNINPDDVAVNFLTDYSTSMINSDLFRISDYFKRIYAGFPNGISTQVAVFSDTIKYRTKGFVTDYNKIQEALDFDHTYIRGGTALYDSWGYSIASLVMQKKPIIINILMTDGFENASSPRSRGLLKDMIRDSGAFNVVIASTWAEPADLNDIIGKNGFVAFKYQIEQSQTIIADIAEALRNMKILRVQDNLDGLDGIRIEYGNEAKLLIPIH
ncbi:MAG: hypothetical protein OEW58_10845 [Gammaproteobacteria bacterium]|nr:hypothetical protein [Gammaproteobacteria bacterium]